MRSKEVYIVGSGGREHTTGWKLKSDDNQTRLGFFPGNAGTREIGRNYRIGINQARSMIKSKSGSVIVGPEKPH